MKVTILGCGGSNGVPLIGGPDGAGQWGACDPGEPRNRRTRSSINVDTGSESLLVDTSPDLRTQLLDNRIARVDAVLYTHEHADHSHGLHELRRLSRLNGRQMDVYADPATAAVLQTRFSYAFLQDEATPYEPVCLMHPIADSPFAAFRIGATEILPFAQDHGLGMRTLGYRIGPVAYSTDVVGLSDQAFDLLAGIGLWIVDCFQEPPHPTHSHLTQTLAWIERVAPGRAVLTHMGPDLDYRTLAARCPPGVEPAYDGMVLEV